MRGWKIILLASTAAILCMAGCGRQEEAICPWANIGAIAETEDSWLCFDGNQLCVLSKEENGTIKPWCGKSSCDHTALTDCPAIMDHKFPNTLAADDRYVYVAGLEGEELFLYRMSLEGKEESLERWVRLAEITVPYCSVESLEADGNWYYLLGTAGDDEIFSWSLGAVALKDGGQENIYTAEAGENLENLKVYKNMTYVCSWTAEKNSLILLDSKGAKEEILPEPVYSYAVKANRLYYSGEKPGIWRKDLKTGETECWIEGDESWLGISWDGKYWYADNYNSVRLYPGDEFEKDKANLNNRRIRVYDENGKTVDVIRADRMEGACLFGGPKALFITQSGCLQMFDKSSIGQERDNSSFEKIFAQYRRLSTHE